MLFLHYFAKQFVNKNLPAVSWTKAQNEMPFRNRGSDESFPEPERQGIYVWYRFTPVLPSYSSTMTDTISLWLVGMFLPT